MTQKKIAPSRNPATVRSRSTRSTALFSAPVTDVAGTGKQIIFFRTFYDDQNTDSRIIAALSLCGALLAGCGSPYDSGARAGSGALIGAGGGAAIGALAGGGRGALIGALAGGGTGAAVGAATTPNRPNNGY